MKDRHQKFDSEFFALTEELFGVAEENGPFRSVNPNWERVLGYPEKEFQSRPWTDWVHPEDRDKILSQTPSTSEAYRFTSKRGKTVWLKCTMNRTPKNEIILLARDISKERELQYQLEIERQKAIANEKLLSLGKMAGEIAHEINNPLAIIVAYAHEFKKMVSKGKIDLSKMGLISDRLIKTSHRIADIIRGLKFITKNGDSEPFHFYAVDRIIEDTFSFCKNRFEKSGVKLTLPKVDPDIKIYCRAIQVSQVLLNLINNALDEMTDRKDGWVTVEMNLDPDYVQFSITDSGKGIPKELQNKILEPFFTTKGIERGTGLGLSISKDIIETHGGEFKLNTNHENTQFVFTVPRFKSEIEEEVKKAA